MKKYIVLLLFGILFLGCQQSPPSPDSWQPLFNGTDLSGWEKKTGKAEYRVENQAIVGKTVKGSKNTFLCTEQEFSDFILTFEVKLDDNPLNSGVQIRSKWDPNKANGHVRGPQVDVEASPPAKVLASPAGESGYLYGEATRREWFRDDENRPPHRVFKNDEWNRFVIKAEGPRYQVWINGEQITDIVDKKAFRSGSICLQVHSIPESMGPYTVRWRDLKIHEIK